MSQPFDRTAMILGNEAMAALAAARVAIFGIGGVGGYAVEALARSGVGALDLIDSDRIEVTNLNRQILALHSTVGWDKVDAAAARVLDINPACAVTTHKIFYLPETRDQIDFSRYDYIIDAVDTVTAKIDLIVSAGAHHVPIISAMGTGNKLDPTALRVADIYETSVCPLAKVMRQACRKRGITALKVVYSREAPLSPAPGTESLVERVNAGSSRRSVPGSVAFVPAAAGLILAGEVVRDLIRLRTVQG